MIFANRILFRVFVTISLIVFHYSTGFPQDQLSRQFEFAKELYEEGNYFDSITELKRLLFFDNNKEYIYPANELIGQSYKAGGKFPEAIQYFTLAAINYSNENELYISSIEIIKINILRRTTQRALMLLDALDSDIRFSEKKKEICYWRGWAYIFDEQWNKAAVEFGKIDPNHELKKICEAVDDSKYSPLKAKILSFILPGAGQFYTKNYLSGILSFGWNLLWGYLTINAFNKDRAVDGLLIGDLLWLRFYRGSIQNSEKFAEEKNSDVSNHILHFLQFDYKGEKP